MNKLRKTLLLIAVLLAHANAFAYDFEVDGLCYTILDEENSEVEISGWTGNLSAELSIPSRITYNNKSYTVTAIGDGAFYRCYNLVIVELPYSVSTIGEAVFENCYGLTSINVDAENSYYTSLDGVLYNKDITTLIQCPRKRDNINIPNSVTNIADYAIRDCSSLTSVEIPSSVTTIGGYAFSGCNSLTSVELPYSVATIGDEAFNGCRSLTSEIVSSYLH